MANTMLSNIESEIETCLSGFLPCKSPVNTAAKSCQDWMYVNNRIFPVLQFFLAIAILIALSITKKRVKLWPDCCQGYCGLAIPVNLLNTNRHRIIYVLIFATLSHSFLVVLSGNAVGDIDNNISDENPFIQSIVKFIIKLLLVLGLCLLYYPVFACVDPPIPIVGHILGAIYEGLLLLYNCIIFYTQLAGCTSGCILELPQLSILVLKVVPVLLISLFLMIWFIGNVVWDISNIVLSKSSINSSTDDVLSHFKRVRNLLKRPKEYSEVITKIKKMLVKIYPYDPGFKFPLRFLATMIISIVLLYQFSLQCLFNVIPLFPAAYKCGQQLLQFDQNSSDYNISIISNHTLQSLVHGGGATLIGVAIILPLSVITSTLLCAIQIYLMFRSISQNLHQSARGDLSFLPKKLPDMKKAMISSLKYPGFQIAYIFWGWIIYFLISFLVLFAIATFVILVVYIHAVESYILPKAAGYLTIIITTFVLYLSQLFIAKWFFLQKAYPNSEHFILNNRRCFHFFSFGFIFLNAFVGIFSTIMRIIIASAFGLLFFIRLDKVLLMKGFEYFDRAQKTYIGFIYLDYTYNNSVLNVFCHILLRENKRKQLIQHNQYCEMAETQTLLGQNKTLNKYLLINDDVHSDDTSTVNKSSIRPLVSQRAYNRWRVAYTLIRNEQLLKYTAANLQANREQSQLQR